MPSSKVLKTGDRVAVPWGVDTREGEVVAVYQTGDVLQVVVRLSVPEGGEDESPTVVLPADSVTPLSEIHDLPAPGTWLIGFRYVREAAEALSRVLEEPELTIYLNPVRSGREIDILVESQRGTIVGEVKTADPLPEYSFDLGVQHLRGVIRTIPGAKGLFFTPSALPPSVADRLRAGGLLSPGIGVVRWRGPQDDKRLRLVIHALLGDDSSRLRATEG